MASNIVECDAVEDKPEVIGISTDSNTSCFFPLKESNHHQKLLEAVQLLAMKIEGMDVYQALQPKQFAEIYSSIENILSVLAAKKPPSQSPLLDQLLDELQKLKTSTSSSPLLATDQWRRLSGIEENLVHVMANIGYDILIAVQDVQSRVAVLTEAHQPAEPVEPPNAFTVNPKYSKQKSIIKYMQFLQQIPCCEGECFCRTSLKSTSPQTPASCCQNVGQLDQQIHFDCQVPFYEVCPIEVIFKSFEYENSVAVIINFAAAASYTNFVSSVFIPNSYGPIPVQIPWMSHMQNVQMQGKVVAEVRFSTKICRSTFFQMNVIDWTDNGNRVVILGKDFVDKYIQSVHHDKKIVILKDPWETEKTFEKPFIYLANVVKDIETKFCRYRLKEEVRDVEDVHARIDRLQRVLVQHMPNSEQIPENRKEEQKLTVNEPNEETSNLKPNSEPQNIVESISKSCNEVRNILKDVQSTLQSKNMQPQILSLWSSLKDEVKENSVSSSQTRIEDKDVYSTVLQEKNLEEVSNTHGSIKSSVEHEFVKPMEKASKSSVQLKRNDSKKGKSTSKSSVKINQDSEKKPAEIQSKVKDEEVDSEVLQADHVEKAALVSTSAQHKAHKKCSKLGEREPSYFHRSIVVSEEEISNFPQTENRETVTLDPVKVESPVNEKKDPKFMAADSCFQSNRNEVLNENQKAETLTVTVHDTSLLGCRRIVVKENKLVSEPEKAEKPKMEYHRIVPNVSQKKDNSKQLALIPTSVIKKQFQDNLKAKSHSEERTLKTTNAKTVGPQDVNKVPKPNA